LAEKGNKGLWLCAAIWDH